MYYLLYPKTHRERITDTAKIIPKHIPVPQSSYEDHLRRSVDDIVHLMSHKQNCLLPNDPQSVKSALLQIVKIVHRDTTPPISPLKIHLKIHQLSRVKSLPRTYLPKVGTLQTIHL